MAGIIEWCTGLVGIVNVRTFYIQGVLHLRHLALMALCNCGPKRKMGRHMASVL